ncbi:MAG TPA: ATP-binding protein [Candidatus Polarisedimenticolaceae bacterium]|nr:ATP-binding protein [Candidatus Polarisedimenticolaceae bacterium]
MGFRGKQIATLVLVAAAVALTTSALNAALLARARIEQTQAAARLLGKMLFHQASRLIRDHGDEPLGELLSNDPALRAYADAVVGYSRVVLYVAIVDKQGHVLFSSNPEGTRLEAPAEPLERFAQRNALVVLWALSQSDHTLLVDLPFSVDGTTTFGSVRVAVSPLFLKTDMFRDVALSAGLAAAAVAFAFLASFYLANQLLAPLEMLRRELQRLDPERGEQLEIEGPEDVGKLAEFFAQVTEKLRAQRQPQAPQQQEDWVAMLLGGLSDAVLVLGEGGRILSLNPAACRLLGRPRAELEGRELHALLPPEHPVAALAAEARSRRASITHRPSVLTVEGREIRHLLGAHVLREAGATTSVMITARDLDGLSRLASQLSYSQKLSTLGQLTSGVAHEIKNPLNSMVMHTALLRRKAANGDPEVRRHLDVLDEEVRRLDRVIEGFVQFSRPEQLQLEALALEAVVIASVEAIAATAERAAVKIETQIPSGLPLVSGNRDLLRQALTNLLTNAVEAMPQGGVLSVSAERADNAIRLVVQDTGVGIPQEALPQVFHLYFTTKPRGSGLGLSVVYRIVQLHGGDVQIASRAGQGTTVTVTLPEVAA